MFITAAFSLLMRVPTQFTADKFCFAGTYDDDDDDEGMFLAITIFGKMHVQDFTSK